MISKNVFNYTSLLLLLVICTDNNNNEDSVVKFWFCQCENASSPFACVHIIFWFSPKTWALGSPNKNLFIGVNLTAYGFFLSLFNPMTASEEPGEAVTGDNGWMDQWAVLQLTPNYYVTIKIYVKIFTEMLDTQYSKYNNFTPNWHVGRRKVCVHKMLTREEREILKNIILSVAGERKPAICERRKQRLS